MRPIKKWFVPLLESATENKIQNIVFLSVQGAEKSKMIPHNKIESLIKKFRFNFIFVRPSYFMQNLTTSFLNEITVKRTITLPAENAKFNWVDVKNIGEACARLIIAFDNHQNQAYEITGLENKSFSEVAELLTEILGHKINYRSINPISFYVKKRREGMKSGFAAVVTMLHFLPKFQGEPKISSTFKKLINKTPTTLEEFIKREKEILIKQ